jgi:VanZ family protein
MKKWLWRWGPALLMMALIFAASGTPGNDLPDFGAWNFDFYKGGHMAGYALLAIAWLRALRNSGPVTRRLQLMSILLAGLYAITDEAHQLFTPGRTSSAIDVGIDVAGAIAGVVVCAWFHSWRDSRARAGQR